MISLSERAKNILLVFLVIVSIVLSFFMRYGLAGLYGSSAAAYGGREISPAVLSAVLKPEDIIINFGGMDHMPVFSDPDYESAWREFQNVIFSGGGNFTSVSREDFAVAMDYRSLTYKFSFPVPLAYFNEANGKKYNLPINTIKDVIILSGSSPTYYIYDGFDKYLRMNLGYKNNGIENIISINEDEPSLYSTARDLGFTDSMDGDILMPLDPESIMFHITGPKIPNKLDINTLVSRYFDSGSMVRKIEEMPGDMVLTDGRKGLKVYKSGRLEYTYSTSSSARVDDITAIKIASDFVIKHLPDMEGISLAGMEEEKDGYTIGYNVRHNGIHVYTKKQKYPIMVKVSGGRVVSMKSMSLGFVDKDRMADLQISALDAMDISFKEDMKHWDELRMCYLEDGGEIREAWRAVNNKKILYVDMKNGNV